MVDAPMKMPTASEVFEAIKRLFDQNKINAFDWDPALIEIEGTMSAFSVEEAGNLVDLVFDFLCPIREEMPDINPMTCGLDMAGKVFQQKFFAHVLDIEARGEPIDELAKCVETMSNARLMALTHPKPNVKTFLGLVALGAAFLELGTRG